MFTEQSESESIFVKRSTCKSLIGVVETAVQVLSEADLEDCFPLFLRRINSSWVVGARVKYDEGVVLCSCEISLHSFKVESLSGCVIVSVVFPVIANQLCYLSVNWPGWVWNQEVDVLVRIEVREEGETDSESSSSGKGLSAGNSALL